ncbi:hypothetical protein BWI96_02370 [Siphonobacter sp. SORGH_AS_0500]|nr:hypothetical protein BWI96_02370 [Siphonobacter sp. SORGH_AS_0500]
MGKIFFKVLIAVLITLWFHALVYHRLIDRLHKTYEIDYLNDSLSTFIVFVFYGMLLFYLFPIGTFHSLINYFKIKNKFHYVILSMGCFGFYGTILFFLTREGKYYTVTLISWLMAGLTYGIIYSLWLKKYLRFWKI